MASSQRKVEGDSDDGEDDQWVDQNQGEAQDFQGDWLPVRCDTDSLHQGMLCTLPGELTVMPLVVLLAPNPLHELFGSER